MTTENNSNGAAAGGAAGGQQEISPVELHDAAYAAVEAYRANPSDETLKTAAEQATAKLKEGFTGWTKAREEEAAKNAPPKDYDLKLPKDSQLDAKKVEEVKEFAKANKLPLTVAQAILERDAKTQAAYVEAQTLKLQEEHEGWKKALVADKEIGGEKATEAAELSKRLIAKVMGDRPDFLKTLDESGLGDHPEFVRMMYRIGKSLGDDKIVAPNGGNGAGAERIPTKEVLFGKSMGQKA